MNAHNQYLSTKDAYKFGHNIVVECVHSNHGTSAHRCFQEDNLGCWCRCQWHKKRIQKTLQNRVFTRGAHDLTVASSAATWTVTLDYGPRGLWPRGPGGQASVPHQRRLYRARFKILIPRGSSSWPSFVVSRDSEANRGGDICPLVVAAFAPRLPAFVRPDWAPVTWSAPILHLLLHLSVLSSHKLPGFHLCPHIQRSIILTTYKSSLL